MADLFEQLIAAAWRRPDCGLGAESVEMLEKWCSGTAEFSRRPPVSRVLSPELPAALVSRTAPPPPSPVQPGAPRQSSGATPVIEGSSLEELGCAVQNCRNCPLERTRNHVVFGEGDPHADLMFIGEGPGGDEDLQGRPFVGRAGQLLDKMITAMQFSRAEVYIGNVVKCRPPGNRTPTPEEAAMCINYLKKQIEFIQPRVLVLLGASAAKYLLERTEGITRLRGRWLEYNGIPVMPTYHPAYLLRQESAKREAWSDLQQVMAKFGKFHRR